MKRCPQCRRFGVEYDSSIGAERCLWDDCLWVNEKKKNIEDTKFKPNFTKFRDALKGKKLIAA